MQKEWKNEPDRKHWVDPETGFDCLILRGPVGALCGYVGVPEGHPWYGKGHNDLEDIQVHGGLTYADKCAGRICHDEKHGDHPAHNHVWWLGFDCAHAGDVIPNWVDKPISPFDHNRFKGEEYRNIAYVEGECAKLARQIKAEKGDYVGVC